MHLKLYSVEKLLTISFYVFFSWYLLWDYTLNVIFRFLMTQCGQCLACLYLNVTLYLYTHASILQCAFKLLLFDHFNKIANVC